MLASEVAGSLIVVLIGYIVGGIEFYSIVSRNTSTLQAFSC